MAESKAKPRVCWPVSLHPRTALLLREAQALSGLSAGRRVTYSALLASMARARIGYLKGELRRRGVTEEQVRAALEAAGLDGSGSLKTYRERWCDGELRKRSGETPLPPVVD